MKTALRYAAQITQIESIRNLVPSIALLREILVWSLFFTLTTALLLYKVVFIAHTDILVSFWIAYGTIISVFLLSRIPIAYLYDDNHTHVYDRSMYKSVSIVIAAKNEEAGIYKTITSCLESDYPQAVECIVIDDGSTDDTRAQIERAQKVFGSSVKLISFDENRGKREAMAAGVQEAQYEIVVFVDSDSFLSKSALRQICEHFIAEPKIGAVAGNTTPENAQKNILTKMQSIQYAISFDIYKASESFFRAVTCCPGCFSAYRKEAILPLLQEWKSQKFLGIVGTFGDDRGLTNFVLKQGWDIRYCESAKATTTVPEKFSVYWRQQLRWKKSWIREGIFAGMFMWKRHPFASIAFYVHFSFPFLGPLLALIVLYQTFTTNNPAVLALFALGFILLGLVFSLFVRAYRKSRYWIYMPLFSLLFVGALIWQMPYALLTVRNRKWGTR